MGARFALPGSKRPYSGFSFGSSAGVLSLASLAPYLPCFTWQPKLWRSLQLYAGKRGILQ